MNAIAQFIKRFARRKSTRPNADIETSFTLASLTKLDLGKSFKVVESDLVAAFPDESTDHKLTTDSLIDVVHELRNNKDDVATKHIQTFVSYVLDNDECYIASPFPNVIQNRKCGKFTTNKRLNSGYLIPANAKRYRVHTVTDDLVDGNYVTSTKTLLITR